MLLAMALMELTEDQLHRLALDRDMMNKGLANAA